MESLLDRPPWFVAGPLLGLIVVAVFATLNERLGVLGGYSELVERAAGMRRSLGWKVWFLVGIVAGAVVFSAAADSWRSDAGYGWLESALDGNRLATGAVLAGAGLLIGVGAKTAGGCTSGNGLSGCSFGSPASFVATGTFMATADRVRDAVAAGMTRVRLTAAALGLGFGFVLSWTQMTDPDEIRRMLLLEDAYFFLVMASSIGVAFAGLRLLRARRFRALVTGQPVSWSTSRPERRHVVGSVLFGGGWGVSYSCPGPIAAQLGQGVYWSLCTIAGIGAGVVLYLYRQRRAAGTSVSAPAVGAAS